MSTEQQTNHDVVDDVARHLLESLDALSVVYESAAFFADVDNDRHLAEHTLERCLGAIQATSGAIFMDVDGELQLECDRGQASLVLTPAALELSSDVTVYRDKIAARDFLVSGQDDRALICAPIVANQKRLGVVAIIGAKGREFWTTDVKLVSAVISQAAIAISSAHHYRDVVTERSNLRSVIEENSAGILLLRPNGRTVLCNSVAREMFDIPKDRAVGADFLAKAATWDYRSDVDLLRDNDQMIELSKGEGGDERVLGLRSTTVRDVHGDVVNIVMTAHDLTEKRREERLKRDFLSLISHKFRSPLTGVVGCLAMLEDDSMPREELLAEGNARTAELTTLVDRLLYFSEILDTSWTTTGKSDLHWLREELATKFAERYPERDLAFEWDLDGNARLVGIPESRLRVVLENLVDNAIKFTESKRVFVRIAARPAIHDMVEIEVEDRGPGIAPEDRESIFESFHQRDDDFTGNVAGTGIGLTIVTEIVDRVGGEVEVRDAEPSGSVFTVRLPAYRGDQD